MISIQNLDKLSRPELREVIVSTIYDEKVRRMALALFEKRIKEESCRKYQKAINAF
jgi:hypothetical protein